MNRKPFDPSRIRAPEQKARITSEQTLTVSQLTTMVKNAIETALPSTVHIVGEISNFKQHSSGHLYFTLKDRGGELACVMWRSAAASMKFSIADGLEVVATGNVTVFERGGRYQLIARKLEPRGVGALELAFRQLCEKLSREGLFEKARKKPLPPLPRRIAVVTSPTGAAIADILRTLRRRFPCVDVLIFPVRVQGLGAAEEIGAAIQKLNVCQETLGDIDLMIVGRGGGSLEDLWAFNEEVVARAIFASRIPVISAVGHETDVTIADLVADVRAATPTAAAEIAVPVLDHLLTKIAEIGDRLTRRTQHLLTVQRLRLNGLTTRRALSEPSAVVHAREQWVDEIAGRIARTMNARMTDRRKTLDRLDAALQKIAPHVYLLRSVGRFERLRHRLSNAVEHRAIGLLKRLERAERMIVRRSPVHAVARHVERIGELSRRLPASLCHRLSLARALCEHQHDLLTAMSYRSVLARGFSITRIKKDRSIVRSTKQVRDRQRLLTQTVDGEFESEVLNQSQLELFNE